MTMYMSLYYKMEELMAQKYFLDKNLTVSKLAPLIGTNRSYLFNLFSKELGIPFIEYINSYRLEYANKIVSKRVIDDLELADICGFKSEKAMRKAIKAYRGSGLEFLKNRYLCKIK